MNVDEAMTKLGFTMRSSVMHALKYGHIRANEQGEIDPSSVEAFAAKRATTADLRALFLKDSPTPEEVEILRLSGLKGRAKRPRPKG